MEQKTQLGVRVYAIAKQYSIECTMVHRIITEYIEYCKLELLSGKVVDFVGLVSVVPDVVTSDYRSTMAYECSFVADRLSLPQHTVYIVIRAYLDDLLDDIFMCKTASIRGIVNIHPIQKDGKLTNIHSAISSSFKNNILKDSAITSVRVHTSKLLKQRLCSGGCNYD